MKLQILSDLHIDSYHKRDLPLGNIPKTDAHLVILAGDISNSSLGMRWAVDQSNRLNKTFVYVAGNHEYFDEDVLSFDEDLRALCKETQVNFLQKNSLDVGHIRFLGCTLWTDFQFGTQRSHFRFMQQPDIFNHVLEPHEWSQKQAMQLAKGAMRDYVSIKAGRNLLSPEMVLSLHEAQRDWLKNALIKAHQDKKTAVVISHHSVSPRSIAPKYQTYQSNSAFVTDFSAWMHEDWAPKLWVHGHTHDAFDYMEGNTRVVVNPRAYPKEKSSTEVSFSWKKTVEI